MNDPLGDVRSGGSDPLGAVRTGTFQLGTAPPDPLAKTRVDVSLGDQTLGALSYGAADVGEKLGEFAHLDSLASSLKDYKAEHPEYAPEQVDSTLDLISNPRALLGRVFGQIPYLLMTVGAYSIPYAGPALAGGLTYAMESQRAYDEAKLSGATEDQASTAAHAMGIINAGLQLGGIGKLWKFASGARQAFVNEVATTALGQLQKSGLSIATQAGKHVVTQALFGAAQQGVDDLLRKKIYGRPIPAGEFDNLLQAAVGQGVAATVFGLGAAALPRGGGGDSASEGILPADTPLERAQQISFDNPLLPSVMELRGSDQRVVPAAVDSLGPTKIGFAKAVEWAGETMTTIRRKALGYMASEVKLLKPAPQLDEVQSRLDDVVAYRKAVESQFSELILPVLAQTAKDGSLKNLTAEIPREVGGSVVGFTKLREELDPTGVLTPSQDFQDNPLVQSFKLANAYAGKEAGMAGVLQEGQPFESPNESRLTRFYSREFKDVISRGSGVMYNKLMDMLWDVDQASPNPRFETRPELDQVVQSTFRNNDPTRVIGILEHTRKLGTVPDGFYPDGPDGRRFPVLLTDPAEIFMKNLSLQSMKTAVTRVFGSGELKTATDGQVRGLTKLLGVEPRIDQGSIMDQLMSEHGIAPETLFTRKPVLSEIEKKVFSALPGVNPALVDAANEMSLGELHAKLSAVRDYLIRSGYQGRPGDLVNPAARGVVSGQSTVNVLSTMPGEVIPGRYVGGSEGTPGFKLNVQPETGTRILDLSGETKTPTSLRETLQAASSKNPQRQGVNLPEATQIGNDIIPDTTNLFVGDIPQLNELPRYIPEHEGASYLSETGVSAGEGSGPRILDGSTSARPLNLSDPLQARKITLESLYKIYSTLFQARSKSPYVDRPTLNNYAKEAGVVTSPTRGDYLKALDNVDPTDLSKPTQAQIIKLAKRLKGVKIDQSFEDLWGDLKDRVSKEMLGDGMDQLVQNYRKSVGETEANNLVQMLRMAQGIPVHDLGPGMFASTIRGVSRVIGMSQTNLAVIPHLSQAISLVPASAGPINFAKALDSVFKTGDVTRSELASIGVLPRTLGVLMRDGMNPVETAIGGGGRLLSQATGFSKVMEWTRVIAGEAHRNLANEWKNGNFSETDLARAKDLRLSPEEIQSIRAENMSDMTYRKIIQNGIATTLNGLEAPHRASGIENRPLLRMIFAYSSYLNSNMRSLLRLGADGKDAFAAMKAGDFKPIQGWTQRFLLTGAGLAGSGMVTQILRGAINGTINQRVEEPDVDKAMGAMWEAGALGAAQRMIDPFKFDGGNIQKAFLSYAPQLGFLSNFTGALLGYGKYGQFPVDERLTRTASQNIPLARPFSPQNFDSWVNAMAYPELEDYISARNTTRSFEKKTLGRIAPPEGLDPINPGYYKVFEGVARGDVEAARARMKDYFKQGLNEGKAPDQLISGLRDSLLQRAPINLREDETLRYLASLPKETRVKVFRENLRYQATVNTLIPAGGRS